MESMSGAWCGEVVENIPSYAHKVFLSSADRTKRLSHSQLACHPIINSFVKISNTHVSLYLGSWQCWQYYYTVVGTNNDHFLDFTPYSKYFCHCKA